jgi:hypothetical protein
LSFCFTLNATDIQFLCIISIYKCCWVPCNQLYVQRHAQLLLAAFRDKKYPIPMLPTLDNVTCRPLFHFEIHIFWISVGFYVPIQVIEAAKQRPEILVQVGLEYRYMPPVAKLIDIVKSGTLGQVRMVAIREHRFPFLVKVLVAVFTCSTYKFTSYCL